MVKHVAFYANSLNEKLQETCAYLDVDLDGRFEKVRTQETNSGNWVSDLLFTEFDTCDVCILNCGTIRSNQITRKGHITFKQLR